MNYLNYLLISLAFVLQLHAQIPPLSVEPVASGVYVYTSYNLYQGQPFPANGLIVETKKGIVLVDTPWDSLQTQPLLDWIRINLKQSVVLTIITHFHEDRLAGTNILRRQSVKVVSTPLTAELARKEHFPVPDGILPNDTTIQLGGVKLVTFYPGAGHAPDNIVVWLPKQKLLFGGCFVKSVEATTIGNLSDANLANWPVAIRRVEERFPKPAIVVPGHQSWKTQDTSMAMPFGHPALQKTLNLLERKGG